MIIHLSKFRRLISIYFLTIFLCFVWGTEAYGRPGGPAQPEFTSFTPIGSSEMVDKFSGSFAYNIPLFDIGGYPVNIAYDGSVSNDVDASWVGLGWNLNTGSINRSKRGIPDDFKGSKITRSMKKDEVYRLGISPGGHIQILNALGFSLKGGIYYSSLTGYGTEASFGKSLGFPIKVNGKMTIGPSIGENTSSSSDGGVTNSFNVGMNVGTSFDMANKKSLGLDLGLSYGESTNSRQGLMQTGFNASLSAKLTKNQFKEVTKDPDGKYRAYDGTGKTAEQKKEDKVETIKVPRTLAAGKLGGIGFSKSFIDPTFTPTIEIPYNNKSYSLNLKAGFHGVTIDGGGTLDGYATFQNLAANNFVSKGYGFLYSENALTDPDRLMDFNREKDVPFHVKVPNIAIPQMTYDLFTINQHQNGGQFRAYRNDVGLIKDQTITTTSNSYNLGLEAHFSAIVQFGATIDVVNSETKTIPFIEDALKPYDFCPNSTIINPLRETYVFRKTSEVESPDVSFYSKINQLSATNLQLDHDGNRNGILESRTGSFLNNLGLQRYYTQDNNKVGGRFYRPNLRNTYISALNIEKRELYSADKKIMSYSASGTDPYMKSEDVTSSTIGSLEDKNLLSEFTVVNPDGSKYHYGIPVMNKKQEEYSFSIPKTTPFNFGGYTGLVQYNSGALGGNIGNTYDGYYSKETTPAYAHAWLLSGIYSPDYQDITSNGITEDDRGNAIKFNYTKKGNYTWRNPINPDKSSNALANLALHNKGIEYVEDDDKAIVNYGEREEWYNHSIESKATLAIFITKPRDDARPMNLDGSVIKTSGKERLEEIRLYSKFEIEILKKQNPSLTRDQLLANATPIKTIKFFYDYSLCPYTPNSTASGKLTLTEIHIMGGKNTTAYKYKFGYGPNDNGNGNVHNPSYNAKNIDRWGNYKPASDNSTYFGSAPNLTNDAFPYTIQNKDLTKNVGGNIGNNANDKNAQAWLLKTVTLPSGGTIDVSYESHDYSYVQNKRTSKMFKLVGIGNNALASLGNTRLYEGYKSNNFLFFETDIPSSSPTLTQQEVKDLFFKDINDYGSDKYIFYKTRIKMPNGKVENLPGWAEVKPDGYGEHSTPTPGGKKVIWVELKSIPYTIKTTMPMFGGALNKDLLKVELSPIARNSWQFIRDYIPELAWDGYTLGKNPDPFDVITSLLGNIGKIFAGERQFEVQCIDRGLAQEIVLDGASFVRAYIPTKTKFGGSGSRVRRVSIRDNWAELTGITDPNLKPEDGIYTYDYEYTTKEKGQLISSGVASYEPLIGGEENSWRQPVFYEGQMGPGGPTSMNSIEKPFGESLFPNPHVGYSVVKVVANKDKAALLNTGNGHKEYEYYTAKDFPVQTENTELNDRTIKRNKNSFIFDILGFGGNKFDRTSVSQGYSIILNDMHGKPKGEKTFKFGNSDVPISYTKNYYKNTTELPVITDNNQIINKNVGVQSDFFVDARFQTSSTSQKNFNPGGGIEPPPAPVPIFWFTFFAMFNSDEKSVRMISTNKVTSKSFPKYKTEINTDGALVTTEDLLWDDKTGHIVLSKMTNEFNGKTVFNLNMPAYWNYKNLGHIYHTQDAEIRGKALASGVTACTADFCIQSNGVVLDNAKYLQDGDEVFLERRFIAAPVFLPQGKYFFIKKIMDPSANPPIEVDLLVDANGVSFAPSTIDDSFKVRIIRSVNKNQMSAPGLSVVSNETPINGTGTSLKASVSKVLNAQSTEYLDDWRTIIKNKDIINTVTGAPYVQFEKNAIVSGIKGDIKPYKAYGVIGNRTGFTNAGEKPNVANDDIMTNNPMTSGDVLQIPYNFNSGFTTIGWDFASETSLYDSKGNLVEDKIRMCRYGYCLGTQPPPAAPPTPSAPENKSNIMALGFVSESEVKSESKLNIGLSEIDNGKTIMTKIKDSFPLDSNYLGYGRVEKTNLLKDNYDKHILPSNFKELSLEEKRKYIPKEILANPYYKLAEKEARLIERGEENVDGIVKAELTKIVEEKYENYLECDHTECEVHSAKMPKEQFMSQQQDVYSSMQDIYMSAASEIYHSEDVLTTAPCEGGSFENNGQPFSTYTADWHARYSHSNSNGNTTLCNDDLNDISIYTYDPTLDQNDNGDLADYVNCRYSGFTGKHYKIVPRANDPVLNALLMTTRAVGNNYSLKLGNDQVFGYAESISKRFIVTEANSYVSFWYAVVFQEPNHSTCEDPIFGVRVYRNRNVAPEPYANTNLDISGTGTSHVNTGTVNSSYYSTFTPTCNAFGNNATIKYRNWTCGALNLSQYIGDTISLEFFTKDCKQGGHFGYAYIDDISCSSFDCHNKGDVKNFRHVTSACNKMAIDYELPNMSGTNTGRIFLTLKIYNANNILVEERTQNLQNAGTGYQTYTFSDLPLHNGFRAEIEAKFYMYNATVPYKTMNATSTPPISNVTITNAPNIVTVNFRKDGCKKVCVDYNFPCATNLNKVIPKFKLMVYDHKSQIMVEREVYGTVMTNSSTYTYCFDRITLVNGGRVELSVDYYVYYHINSKFLIKSETLSPISIENCYNTCFIDDGIYSSSKYGFNRTLPTIVAGNAKYHEIDFASFEDNDAQNLELHDGIIPKFPCTSCGSSQLVMGSANNAFGEAHTGKHMIQATNSQGLVYKIYAKPAADLLPGSEWTGAVVKVNAKHVYPQFNFLANKTYKLSFWVKGVSANDANGLVTVKCSHPITGKITNYNEASFTSPIIEKWRLCEMLIPLDEIDFSEMEIKIRDVSGTIYIDDIRLVPDDADAKSFVYDYKSLRLIGELDENHFTTFYDYDDAGNLIRIRKETEKGIVTLKEASFNYQNKK